MDRVTSDASWFSAPPTDRTIMLTISPRVAATLLTGCCTLLLVPPVLGDIEQRAYLKASNTDTGDVFGSSVAVSGNTAVVGAYQESSGATGVNGDEADNSTLYAGAVYVFVRNGTTWQQQAYLKASNAGWRDRLGYSVGISGDTVVVGAYTEESAATGVNGDESDDSAPTREPRTSSSATERPGTRRPISRLRTRTRAIGSATPWPCAETLWSSEREERRAVPPA